MEFLSLRLCLEKFFVVNGVFKNNMAQVRDPNILEILEICRTEEEAIFYAKQVFGFFTYSRVRIYRSPRETGKHSNIYELRYTQTCLTGALDN